MTVMGGAGNRCAHAYSGPRAEIEMDNSVIFLLILLFVCTRQQNGLSSSAHNQCQLEYRMEYGNGLIVITPQEVTSSPRSNISDLFIHKILIGHCYS